MNRYPRNRISHAVILISSPESGRANALSLAADILCPESSEGACGVCDTCRKAASGVHSDIYIIDRPLDDKGNKKKEYAVEQIREIVRSAYVLPNEASKKVYIILEADRLGIPGQNAFLKLLEEPPEFDSFILVSERKDKLLQTVVSRCTTITAEQTGVTFSEEAGIKADEFLSLLSEDKALLLADFASDNSDMTTAFCAEFLSALIARCADICIGKGTSYGISTERAFDLIEVFRRLSAFNSVNVSAKSILAYLMTV
ncbi:MAG: hypothetical protein MJ067_01080 [Oscillospiraceae bacterium]|nr:hypothetical protein [Oscillospiraceae bacterium]